MNTNKKTNNKVILLGIILLIVAGIIVVALKGFCVTLMFGKHESIELRIGKEVNMGTVKEICDEIFTDKEYVAKELEVFGDSFQVNVESITDDEKANLVAKVNEKFETEFTVDDLNIHTVPKKRIREAIRNYVVPVIIMFVLVIIYSLIRYRKIGAVKVIAEYLGKIVLLEAVLLSIVAIARIRLNDLLIIILVMVPILHLTHFMNKNEKRLQEYKEKQ